MEPALKEQLLDLVDRLPAEKQAQVLEFTRSLTPLAEDARSRGVRLASTLERVAQQGGIMSIADPSEWQREQRRDRPLPGRG